MKLWLDHVLDLNKLNSIYKKCIFVKNFLLPKMRHYFTETTWPQINFVFFAELKKKLHCHSVLEKPGYVTP